jgi:hypothetical protein
VPKSLERAYQASSNGKWVSLSPATSPFALRHIYASSTDPQSPVWFAPGAPRNDEQREGTLKSIWDGSAQTAQDIATRLYYTSRTQHQSRTARSRQDLYTAEFAVQLGTTMRSSRSTSISLSTYFKPTSPTDLSTNPSRENNHPLTSIP